jgi:hypothetical protein
MIEALISSKTRVKMLLKFFLNANSSGYLRGLEQEFGESSNSIRIELNRFENAGMLVSYSKGNKKFFQANRKHPLFNEIHNIVLKHIGFDTIINNVIEKLGDVKQVYIAGDFASGKDSQIIDLIFVGEINQSYLINLVQKAEKLITRKIRFIIFEKFEDIDLKQMDTNPLLLWENE